LTVPSIGTPPTARDYATAVVTSKYVQVIDDYINQLNSSGAVYVLGGVTTAPQSDVHAYNPVDCSIDAHCNDTNPCTIDYCKAGCKHYHFK
jgi:hypothetical protein